MKILTNNELLNINGGAFNVKLFFGISAVITFLIGVIDGIIRPYKCN